MAKGAGMCGIAALFGIIPDGDGIAAMTKAAAHRGPDGAGILCFAEGRAQLGHQRLSILDLSSDGHQPLSSPCGRAHITYNGEIYNYIELKRELQGLGHTFRSSCDTEVLLAAYIEWGAACLPRLNGMFAFVIYDAVKKEFFAARDRFGVKPLYVWPSPLGYVALASEIKQFGRLPGFKAKLNHQRAYDFLNWSVIDHTEETLFAGVFQLRGGEYWKGSLSDLTFRPCVWYEVPCAPFKGSLQDAGQLFYTLLSDSVRLRLRSDAPVGSCLSGGLDSSSIVCLINEQLKGRDAGKRQKTFSACSHVAEFDERPFMDLVVAKVGHEAHFITPKSEGLLRDLDQLVWAQDEPFATTSLFAQWEVFKLARQNSVKVMLDGQGADEQLAGYTSCYGHHFKILYRTFQWRKLFAEMKAARKTLSGHHPIKFLGSHILPERIGTPLKKFYRRPSSKPNWMSFRYLHADDRNPFPETAGFDLPDYCRHMTLKSSLPMLLHFEDRNSMAHSIEARTPFLDYRLVELTLNLPAEHKIADGLTKRVMREGMRSALPARILERRDKIGFATAEAHWLKTPQFRPLIQEGIQSAGGIISPDVLTRYDRMVKGKEPFSSIYWKTICFGRWLKLFDVQL